MKTKILNVNQVVVDKETYPRHSFDWVTKARYYNAMKSGAQFPPIVVSLTGGKYYLVDGLHRLMATKDLKGSHITAEVLNLPDKKTIYVEAVKRNIVHGRQFSTQEVTNIVITLENWQMSKQAIQEIVRIPAKELQPFVAKRMVSIMTQDGSTTDNAVKSILKHLAGTTQNEEFLAEQDDFQASARSSFGILDTLITMLENGLLDTNDSGVMRKLTKIYDLLNTLTQIPVIKATKKTKTKKNK